MYTRDMWSALKIIAALLACYVAIGIWVYASQRRMLYIPSFTEVGTPADAGLDFEEVWLTNELGDTIHGWWVPCENARFTMLFSHGNAGNVTHRIPSLQIFHDLGLSVFIYDYSGYGRSEGEPSEIATEADTRAAWQWLTETQQAAPESIILFGRSLGGAVAAKLATDLTRQGTPPAGIIMESTFTSVPDMAAHLYPWLPVRTLSKFHHDSMSNLADVHVPGLFAHSPDDEIVPFTLGARLYESYTGPKQFFELRGSHNSGYVDMGQAYPEGLDRFLRTLEGNGHE